MADPNLPFRDANAILHHTLHDRADRSLRATALVGRIESGDQQVATEEAAGRQGVGALDK
jgi:hypothetical protein